MTDSSMTDLRHLADRYRNAYHIQRGRADRLAQACREIQVYFLVEAAAVEDAGVDLPADLSRCLGLLAAALAQEPPAPASSQPDKSEQPIVYPVRAERWYLGEDELTETGYTYHEVDAALKAALLTARPNNDTHTQATLSQEPPV